ncbi:hypothetical protein K7432_009431 [Basidiobolus ranarum]|uniref:Uncharacterized protein n=1 Tax=Basidiobolus ranarum TaxID=34480 RepID=A0ABR2WQA2_9FUNG
MSMSDESNELRYNFNFDKSENSTHLRQKFHASEKETTSNISIQFTTETNSSVTNSRLNFRKLTSILFHSWGRLLRSKRGSWRLFSKRAASRSASNSKSRNEKDRRNLTNLESAINIDTIHQEEIRIRGRAPDRDRDRGRGRGSAKAWVASKPAFYRDINSHLVTELQTISLIKIAYFNGLEKLRDGEHRRLHSILLIHQIIHKAQSLMITKGLNLEPPWRSTLLSLPSFVPSPCEDDDVPLGVLQLEYKRSTQ